MLSLVLAAHRRLCGGLTSSRSEFLVLNCWFSACAQDGVRRLRTTLHPRWRQRLCAETPRPVLYMGWEQRNCASPERTPPLILWEIPRRLTHRSLEIHSKPVQRACAPELRSHQSILWSKNKVSFASEPNLVLFCCFKLNNTPQEAQKDQLFLSFSH